MPSQGATCFSEAFSICLSAGGQGTSEGGDTGSSSQGAGKSVARTPYVQGGRKDEEMREVAK